MHQLEVKQLFFFLCACPVEKVQSCNSLLSEHTYHKPCHTSVRIPLTSLVPADFLLWCSQRATETHKCTHSHTHTHTPTLVHTHIHEQTYIHTFLRWGHHVALGLNRRTLDISICVTRFDHFLHKNRTACLQMCHYCCALVYNLITHIL